MRIAVYGASGYTGRLVAAELAGRGIDMLLLGRDERRLRAVADETPGADSRVAGLDDPAALVAALDGCDAVVNCVAPFVAYGEPVARAAIAAGCHYVDTTGEQLYVKRLFDAFDAEAERAGVTVVPAATDEGVPGDLIAHLVAERVTPVEELTVAHRVIGGAPSRGTLRSALANIDTFTGGALGYADGRWRAEEAARQVSVTFPGDAEPSATVRLAAPGVITVPRHVHARRVEAVTDAELVAGFAAVDAELVEGMPEGPSEEGRRAVRFVLVADVLGRDGRRARGTVHGSDMYGTTAVVAVETARRIIADGAHAGVLAPAQAFDPAGFLDGLAPHGLRWAIERDIG